MPLDKLLTTLGTLITLATAAFMLWRARKMQPAEYASTDAGAAKEYAEAAKMAAEQVMGSLQRIDSLEKLGATMTEEVKGLHTTLLVRDKYIEVLNEELKRRDILIEDWTEGITILIAQIREGGGVPRWSPKAWGLRSRG